MALRPPIALIRDKADLCKRVESLKFSLHRIVKEVAPYPWSF